MSSLNSYLVRKWVILLLAVLDNLYFSDSNYIPVQLTLRPEQQKDDILNFMITWKPNELANVSDYVVRISPPSPPCGINEFTSTNSVKLSLEGSITQYDITVSLSACPDRINTTFVLGKSSYQHYLHDLHYC